MNQVLRKPTMNLDVVKKISSHLNKKSLDMLYHSMIVSHIRYFIKTWCNGNKTTLLKIQRIANKFIRMIHGIYYKGSVKNAMCTNGLMTVEQIQQLKTACFMFKNSKNLLPNCFANFFSNNLVDPNDKIKTRSNSAYFPSFCRLIVTQQCLKYRGPVVWNKIPLKIKELKAYKKFRNELKRQILHF